MPATRYITITSQSKKNVTLSLYRTYNLDVMFMQILPHTRAGRKERKTSEAIGLFSVLFNFDDENPPYHSYQSFESKSDKHGPLGYIHWRGNERA